MRVVEAAAPDGVTVAGEKVQDAPAGNPEQVNETAELNPLAGVANNVVLPLLPAVIVREAGEVATEKSGDAEADEGGWYFQRSFRSLRLPSES